MPNCFVWATTQFVGEMTRVDVDNPGCHTVWESTVRSAALPHLSIADSLIYTITRIGPDKPLRPTSSPLPSSTPPGKLIFPQPKSGDHPQRPHSNLVYGPDGQQLQAGQHHRDRTHRLGHFLGFQGHF
jgi:hypothetical protein